MKKTLLGVLTLCMVGALCLVENSQAAVRSKTIKIGAIFSVTGPASFLGAPEEKTVKLLVDQINAAADTKTFLANYALDAFPGTPESMAELLRKDMERWGGYVRLAKIEPQ